MNNKLTRIKEYRKENGVKNYRYSPVLRVLPERLYTRLRTAIRFPAIRV